MPEIVLHRTRVLSVIGELVAASVPRVYRKLLFDWLITGQVAPSNPASAVRGPKLVVKTGKTWCSTARNGGI
jgi:hypothetical protein